MWFYIVSMDPEASHQTATSHGRKGNGIYGKNQWSYTSISAWIPQRFYIYVRPAATISSSSSHGIISMNASIRIQNLYPSAPMMMQPTIIVHIQIQQKVVCRRYGMGNGGNLEIYYFPPPNIWQDICMNKIPPDDKQRKNVECLCINIFSLLGP